MPPFREYAQGPINGTPASAFGDLPNKRVKARCSSLKYQYRFSKLVRMSRTRLTAPHVYNRSNLLYRSSNRFSPAYTPGLQTHGLTPAAKLERNSL